MLSEIKGGLIAMLLFVAIIIPALLYVSIGSLQQHAFVKITTEVTEVVKDEGGITSKVDNIVRKLESRGYTIVFKDSSGSVVRGKRDFGENIVIDYKYKYHNVRGDEELKTQNVVFVNRR